MIQCKWLLTGMMLLSVIACSPQNSGKNAADTGLNIQGQGIIGGITIPKENILAKSVVAVYDPFTKSLCTGSLLRNNLVLTAAHCIPKEASQLFIIFTADIPNAKTAADLEIRRVDKAEASTYWEKSEGLGKDQGDIALIHYVGETPTGFKPATMLTNSKLLVKDAPVILTGYGISDGVQKVGSGVLRATYVSIADPAYGTSEITLDQRSGRGACHGDSGGPAYVYNKTNNTYHLWGITSRGLDDDDDDCSKLVIYTNISAHSAWIKAASKRLTTSIRTLAQQSQFTEI